MMNAKKLVIAVIGVGLVLTFAATAADKEEHPESDFKPLFNGKDLKGWEGDTEGYVVENGNILCKPGGNLYTKEDFGDFVFRFEFKLTPGANNGLGIRMAKGVGDAAYGAMELQILENTADKYKDLESYQYHGSIYGVVPAKRGYQKPIGEWNEQEVVVKGHHVKVTLNGTVIVDADVKEASKNGTMDKKKHPGLLRLTGRIGFLGHGDLLYFRNIRVKSL